MLRAILAVIAGYIAMAIVVGVTAAVVWMTLGEDFAYSDETYLVSTGWCVLSVALGGIAAVIGGVTTVSIARTAKPVKVLAGIVLVLGLVFAVMAQMPKDDETTEPVVRPEGMTMSDATIESRQPAWYSFALPLVGCAGVLLGGRMCRCGGRAASGGEA